MTPSRPSTAGVNAAVNAAVSFARSLPLTAASIEALYEKLLGLFEVRRPTPSCRTWAGILIAIDGHSGTGKDTQIALLEQWLGARSEGPLAGNRPTTIILKRQDPFRVATKSLWAAPRANDSAASFLLLSAGRRYVAEAVAAPLLEHSGSVVIQNRSFLSHVAYHASAACDVRRLLAVCEDEPKPDLTLVLTCSQAVARARIVARATAAKRAIQVNETPAFIDRVRPYFLEAADLMQNAVVLDSTADVETVARDIRRHVETRLARRRPDDSLSTWL